MYGTLTWNDLLYLRTHHANAGNLYHPDVQNTYLKPHGYYSGASNFFRHDLYHQDGVSTISHSEKTIYAFLHQQEELYVAKINTLYTGVNAAHPPYSMSFIAPLPMLKPNNLPLLDQLFNASTSFCQSIEQHYGPDHLDSCKKQAALPLSTILTTEKPTESLFLGHFADMDMPLYDTESMEQHVAQFIFAVINGLHINASWHFQNTLNAYTVRLFDAMAEHRTVLEKETGINLDEVKRQLALIGADDGLDTQLGTLLSELFSLSLSKP